LQGADLRVEVMSCYEAGYDGFWLHRVLEAHGIHNHVLDPASFQVNRRARRPKTLNYQVEEIPGSRSTRSIRGTAFVRSRQKEAPDERGFMSKGGTLLMGNEMNIDFGRSCQLEL
jgi:hypothetical protein